MGDVIEDVWVRTWLGGLQTGVLSDILIERAGRAGSAGLPLTCREVFLINKARRLEL